MTHSYLHNLTSALDAELAAVAGEYPPADVSQTPVRKRLNAYRTVLRRFMQTIARKHGKKESGIMISRILSEVVDSYVRHAYSLFFGDEISDYGPAVVALGGYGRRELNPYSDIDILCLVRKEDAGVYDTKISDMLQFLWDMKLDLGHSTRTLEECIDAAQTDGAFATSLLDARFLAGSEAVWEEHKERCAVWSRDSEGKRLVMEKIEERRQRLETYHGTVQIQEPNVKECPGALRDIHVSRWLLILTGKGSSINDLHSSGLLSGKEALAYESDLDFFLRVRHALHFLTGKRSDLLDNLILPEAAKNLGYTGGGIRPVEKLMHDYYMRTGRVRRLTDRIIKKIIEDFSDRSAQHFISTAEGILVGEKDVRLPPDKADILIEQPYLLVTLFAVAGARGLPISGSTASVIQRALETCPRDFSNHPEVREAFHELFNMKKGVARALRLLHEYGILTKLIPEFDGISWHYQYDFYHTYTTDEHSIRVVENLELITVVRNSTVPELSEIISEVTAKSALYLAGLLHDIGKKGGSGHAHRGELMAARALKRLGYDHRTIELVRFLIREHLLMSHISQRRDTDDEETIRDFIERVGSAGRLRMLTLLTFADLMALSRSALTEWKKALLRGLYNKALLLIEKGYEQHIGSTRKHNIENTVQALKRQFPGDVVRKHLNLLPEQYLRVTGRPSVKAHIRGIERMKKHGAWASFQHTGDVSLLTVITPDYPKALSDICGTITSSDINIIGARIFTRNDGIIIDTFLVMNGNGDVFIPPETQKEFKKNIVSVISKEADVTDLIHGYSRRWRRRKKSVVFTSPRIRVHNDISSKYTVIDVFAIDYTGLLYDITSVLASLNIDIHTARVGTDEDQVADAFYVKSPDGGKIEDEKSIRKMTEAIINKLNEAYK